MNTFLLQRLVREEEGQTLVEYGLLVSLVALAVITAVTVLGSRTHNALERAGANIHTTT